MSAADLKVPKLRSELARRGLDTSGNKPALVQRLEQSLRKENQKAGKKKLSADSSPSFVRKKRARDEEDGGSSAVEELQRMGDPVKKEKLVKATSKGGAVLDQWLPEPIKSSYHVLRHGEDVYNAILNQTNVGDNNNKFYIIQALESDSGGTYMVYNRWGRVGVKGQDKLCGPYTSLESAINEFEKKFTSKTKNQWSNRKNFTCHPKCYTWLEMDYGELKSEAVQTTPNKPLLGTQPRESQLDPHVARFISLICDISMMEQQMLEIGYNAEKLPLGKLSKSTILKGYDVLKRISAVIGKSDRKELESLSGEFYTVIPHDFGFRKMRDFVIDSPFKLQHKLEMVEALGEIEVATKLLMDDMSNLEDPLYSRYQKLNCVLTPVDVNSAEYSMIEKYMFNTHAKTHSDFSVNIAQILKVSRKGETECFEKFACTRNRMLLWHGSRLTNWTGILSQGLRIAPPEAPATGYMFGKGVYFADMFSKSANYCCATSQSRSGVLVLCEVALGNMAELLTADYNAARLPEGKQSTKGVGATEPDPSEFLRLDSGVVVPFGKPKERSGHEGSLLYNEYIVYNVEQIKMSYIVHVDFKFKW